MSEGLSVVRIPIDNPALARLEALLREADAFTTSFQDSRADAYGAATYLREALQSSTETMMLLDRNVVTRLVSLGTPRGASAQSRLAAAVLAFAQTIGAGVEPCLAVYELVATAEHASPQEEIEYFRRLDNTHPQVLADFAVGRDASLDSQYVFCGEVEAAPAADFSMPLGRWEANYAAALKIGILELTPGSAESKMAEFLRWMERDFLFSSPAFCLAMRYLAPNGPRKRLFKNLRSKDREKALAGIRNAAWDLAVVSEWSSRLREQSTKNRLWVLASLDGGLHEVARANISPTYDDRPISEVLEAEFVALWGAARGRRLANLARGGMQRRDDGESSPVVLTRTGARGLIDAQEHQIRHMMVRT